MGVPDSQDRCWQAGLLVMVSMGSCWHAGGSGVFYSNRRAVVPSSVGVGLPQRATVCICMSGQKQDMCMHPDALALEVFRSSLAG